MGGGFVLPNEQLLIRLTCSFKEIKAITHPHVLLGQPNINRILVFDLDRVN